MPDGPALRLPLSRSQTSGVAVPRVGLASVPIPTRAGATGRGKGSTAMSPNALTVAVAVAALGLPDSLTHHLAERPHQSRRMLAIGVALAPLLTAVARPLPPLLADGDRLQAAITLIAAPGDGTVGAGTADLTSSLFGTSFALVGTGRAVRLPISPLGPPRARERHAVATHGRMLPHRLGSS